MLDEILSFFGGKAQPMMAQLVDAGKLTLEDIKEVEKAIRERGRKLPPPSSTISGSPPSSSSPPRSWRLRCAGIRPEPDTRCGWPPR